MNGGIHYTSGARRIMANCTTPDVKGITTVPAGTCVLIFFRFCPPPSPTRPRHSDTIIAHSSNRLLQTFFKARPGHSYTPFDRIQAVRVLGSWEQLPQLVPACHSTGPAGGFIGSEERKRDFVVVGQKSRVGMVVFC